MAAPLNSPGPRPQQPEEKLAAVVRRGPVLRKEGWNSILGDPALPSLPSQPSHCPPWFDWMTVISFLLPPCSTLHRLTDSIPLLLLSSTHAPPPPSHHPDAGSKAEQPKGKGAAATGDRSEQDWKALALQVTRNV